MKNDQLDRLLAKYLAGTATESETEELLTWYRDRINDGDVEWPSETADEKENLKIRMLEQIGKKTFLKKRTKARNTYLPRYAAAALLLLGLSLGLFWMVEQKPETPFVANDVAVPDQQVENRYVLLPDSSTVILRPGSHLLYVSDFSGRTREVELQGEGYFEIANNPKKPFIVHTGEIKTTVLGTKFTVKTGGDDADVSVSVKEGKVKVQTKDVMIAELAANEQVLFDTRTAQSKQIVLEQASPAFVWTTADMRFDGVPFGELAERLKRRYAVEISFADPALKNCLVSGRFDATETLDMVLGNLCATRNATYEETKPGKFVIYGDGC